MDTIKVDKTEIVNISKEIMKLIDSEGGLLSCIQKIDEKMNEIANAWRGIDADKYIDAVRFQYLSELNDLKGCVESFYAFLSTVPDKYTEVDDEAASAFNAIEV